MRHLLPFLIILVCSFSFGQNNLLNTAISWFSRTDRTTIDTYLKNYNYQFMSGKDSLDLQLMSYSLVKTENGTHPFIHILLGDTALEFISVDTYGAQGQQLIVSGLKSGRFKSIGTDINGNFITTTYDNGTFLIQEDYEAVGNPLGKGEIAYFRYRIFRKYGKFDTMNGEKIQLAEQGTKITANYKNGVLDGQRTTYFPNGTIKRTENYRAGRLNGTASDYNQQGKLIHSSTHSYHWKYGMEKWYNNEGEIVKSLQWQRDIPTGVEKQTFNGTVIGSVSYVKGAKQGLAKIPVYYDATIEASYPLDTLNDEPLAIETVTYVNGLKTGKAVCTYFNTADTMYVGHYKAGKLDSIFSRYGKDGILYTTFFSDGLENGSRIFRIPSGPLKDSIYRVENYKEGKLNGLTTQYYQKESDQWRKIHQEENYLDGIRNGAFVYQDQTNKNTELYLDGKLHGPQEYEVLSGGKKTIIRKNYENGLRTGEWTAENMTDAVLVTENYKNNKKQGTETKKIKGKLVEKRFFHDGVLIHIKSFYENGDYSSFDSDESESQDSVIIAYAKKSGDTTSLKCYSFSRTDFPRKDTLLLLLAAKIQASPTENIASNGLYSITTPSFHASILLKNRKKDGRQHIMYGKSGTGVMEQLVYQNDSLVKAEYREYKNAKDIGPYSGVFFSDYSHEKIAVKAGLRHGWCAEHTVSGKEIRRMKYKKGVLIKMVEYHSY